METKMTTRREKLLKKLNPKLLKMTPKLSGDTGSFIDLNSNDSALEDGAKELMKRFMRNQDLCDKFKRKSEQTDSELTVSSVRYDENKEVCELVSEKLIIPLTGDDELESEKPGRKLQKLKMELQDKMSAKWEEEYKKRVNENNIYKGCKESKTKDKGKKLSEEEASDDELDNEKLSEGEDDEEPTKDNYEDEHDDFEADIKDEGSNDCDAASVDGENDGESTKYTNSKDDYNESQGCSLVPAYQPGGGLLYGGSELSQGEEDLPQNLLSSLTLSINDSQSSKFLSFSETTVRNKEETALEEADNLLGEKNNLFSSFQGANDSFDLNDAYDLCSGKFPDVEAPKSGSETQASILDSAPCDDSQDPQSDGDKSEEDEGSVLEKNLPKIRKNIIAFEESETEDNCELNEFEEPQDQGPSVLLDDDDDVDGASKAKVEKKTRKTLHFSDEEDESNNCGSDANSSSSDSEDDEDEEEEEKEAEAAISDNEDFDQRSVNYDSEENEIINPREFFEREAELSGSEFSGDEDERGLDEFDKEDGDADNIDEDLVRSQLGKIYMRNVLDDDAREVRLIQEILFEDGDLHSDGKRRDRKFKWKNLGTFGDKENEEASKEEGGNSSEEECAEEDEQRKIRHDKELFLMEKKNDGDLSSDEDQDFFSLKITSLNNTIKYSVTSDSRIESSKITVNCTEIKKFSAPNPRGSFLTRNEEFLSKLAKATSAVSDNVLGPKNSKNFIFATKSPEKTNTSERTTVCKRQVEESESCRNREKKLKLMPPEIHSGPSILDLMG